jgi:hypothetical protein
MATPVHTRTVDQIQITNDYQDTGLITLGPTNRRRLLRTWRVEAGRDAVGRARLRDTYAKVTLRFVNDEQHHMLVLHDLISLYMVPAESIANKTSK